MTKVTRREDEFDWIDDAFDDKKSQERFGTATGTKAAGCAVVAVVAIVVAITCFAAFAGIIAAALAEAKDL